MNSKRYQGKIIKWKDDRGFGFIKTDGIEKDIFLHINALKQPYPRPKVGDTVYFDLQLELGGKYKAIAASFTKSLTQTPSKTANNPRPTKAKSPAKKTKSAAIRRSSRRAQSKQPSINRSTMSKILNALVFGAILIGLGKAVPKLFQTQSQPVATSSQNPPPAQPVSANKPATTTQSTAVKSSQNCNIKGNISYPDGRKFYHKPGYRDYDKVEIFTNEGERWFCSEQEAVAAGWKDAENH